jgi:hypothetical protein
MLAHGGSEMLEVLGVVRLYARDSRGYAVDCTQHEQRDQQNTATVCRRCVRMQCTPLH